MSQLFATIRSLVARGRYLVSEHATERLEERGVLEWQVVDGVEQGQLIVERPEATPHPAIEVRQLLTEGTEIKAVWSHVISVDIAKLVTVHYFDQ